MCIRDRAGSFGAKHVGRKGRRGRGLRPTVVPADDALNLPRKQVTVQTDTTDHLEPAVRVARYSDVGEREAIQTDCEGSLDAGCLQAGARDRVRDMQPEVWRFEGTHKALHRIVMALSLIHI